MKGLQLDGNIRARTIPESDEPATRRDGLVFDRVFCPAELPDPFDSIEWEFRTAEIRDDDGNILFAQKECEIPKSWSQLAANVVVNKYFFGEVGTPGRETSVRQLVYRVTRTIADWGLADGYFVSKDDCERFYRDLAWLCLHQYGAFNSPVWFNVGLFTQYGQESDSTAWHWNPESGVAERVANAYEFPQASACFIQGVEDTIEGIMRLATSEALLFKFGSGTGTDLSPLRSSREKISGGGTPSGPLSFMRVFDQIAGVVKSGGKTRRAAKMQSLQIWHPDILDFIEAKWKEELKAKTLIASGNYDASFNGETYNSVLFQNANLSVRLSDEFLKSVEQQGRWYTHWVTDASVAGPDWESQYLLERIATCAWHCGDPGVQFDSTINRWHTCPNSGRINASNPCSEFMFIDDSACNLASLNLMKFRMDERRFDVKRFEAACRIFIVAQDILVDRASYPTKEIAINSHRFRPLGLGYANLGGLLMNLGFPYDSDAARGWCGCITAIMHASANLTSIQMARELGSFCGYEDNAKPMNAVMEIHRAAVSTIDNAAPPALRKVATDLWQQVVEEGRRDGFRNAQVTVLAPTGTIGFMMDCCTTGIEPDIALVKYKQLAGGGTLKIVNDTVAAALAVLGYDDDEIKSIIAYIDENDTIEGAEKLDQRHLPVFDCAFRSVKGTRNIDWRAHLEMMAAAQPFLSGAISKTVNMRGDVSVGDVADACMLAWRLGLKAIAIYRDGSRHQQPLTVGSRTGNNVAGDGPRRERLPHTRKSVTHKFSISGHEGYITTGMYPDGRPGELFIVMAKEGSTVGGLMDCFGTAISICLQYGVPLEVLVRKFSHTRFEPMGLTKNPEIQMAKSIVDYIFRWMQKRFLPTDEVLQRTADEYIQVDSTGESTTDTETTRLFSDAPPRMREGRNAQFSGFQLDAPACEHCGAITVRNGNCYLCHNCGNSMGCS